MTDELAGAYIYALTTVCSHAIGARNYFLAGQYVQLCQLMYVLTNIPIILLWKYYLYDAMIWLEMNESTATMGAEWANIAIYSYVVAGLDNCLYQFLNLIDKERYTSGFGIFGAVVHTITIALLLQFNQKAGLKEIAYVHLVLSIIGLGCNFAFITYKGWLDLFWEGMVKQLSFRVS